MEVGITSFINLSCISGLIYYFNKMRKENKSLEKFQKAKVYSPNRLLQYFLRDDFRATAKKSPDNPDEYTIRGFCEGYVDCKNPQLSLIDRKTKLIYSVYYKDEIYSNDNFSMHKMYQPNHKQTVINAPLYFAIRDPHSKEFCLIHRSLEVNADSALERIAERRELKQLSIFEKILLYVGMIIEFLAITTKNTFTFRGIKIGWQENEFGINLGSVLTAYGDIIYNAKDKTLRIDTPKYFLLEKSNIIKDLRSKIFGTQFKFAIMMIPFILSSAYLIRRAIKAYRNYARRKREQQLDKLRNIRCINLGDDYRCIICLDRPRNVILKPCLHFSMCITCYDKISSKKECPVCKKGFSDAIEVFFT